MADWTFDGANKIIKEPASAGDTVHDIKRDIYSAWKRWVQTGNGQYDAAFVIEGGTPIGATGLFTGYTIVLSNGWKLMGGDWDHQALLIGNLYSDDGIATTANPNWNANIFISSAVAAQGIETAGGGSGASASEIADAVLDEVVAAHTIDGSLGKIINMINKGIGFLKVK